jgi:hypothetical protein
VPALTFGVSANFALANFLACRSFGNVSVALACVRLPGPSSNETYRVPWDLSAMRPSARLRRRLGAVVASVTSETTIDRDLDSFRAIQSLPACQPSGFVLRAGRHLAAFRAKTHWRASLSHGGSFSFSGRECKAPVVSAGSSPGPRYRFSPYTAPHDNNTLRISAPAVAMTISRLPDLSVNAAPPVLHPKRAYRG